MSVALYTAAALFSPRHVPSWLLLAFGAGSVNAGALLACQQFVTHVTGTATRLGLTAGLWTVVVESGVLLACFILGSMASVLSLEGRMRRGKTPRYALPLLVVAAILASVALAGWLGLFGPFGQTVEEPADFAMLSVLGFAMGLQNAAVSTATGMAIRTTHMTGPATDLGVHLATSFFISGEARAFALRSAALRGGKLAAFILGGVAMVPICRAGGYLAFVVPAVTTSIAAALSFRPSRAPASARVPL